MFSIGTFFSQQYQDGGIITIIIISLALVGGLLLLIQQQQQQQQQRNHNHKDKPWPNVKGALPLIGNFHQVRSPIYLANKLEEWAHDYGKEEGVFEINLAGVVYLVVCREDRAKEVLLHRPYRIIRNTQITEAARSMGADGVFSAEGARWKADRRVVAPAFNHTHVQDYMKHMATMVTRLMTKWERTIDQPTVINKDVMSFTLDTTALTTTGKDFDSLRSLAGQEVSDITTIFELAFSRTLSPVCYWKIPLIGQYLDGAGWSRVRFLKLLSQLVDDAKADQDGDTFVKKALSQNLKDPSFTHERIIGNILTAFVGGTDSNASTLCSIIHTLATDKTGLQEALFQDVAALPPDLSDIQLSDLHNKVPLLQAFIYEIHRCQSAFPIIFFETADKMKLFETDVPRGRQIMLLSRYIAAKNIHTAPNGIPLGPNGESHLEFCPRRFLKQKDDDDGTLSFVHPAHNSTSFLTFGHGSRICPGKAFSDAIVSLTLVGLIRTFQWELAPDHEPIGRIMGFAEIHDVDIQVVFTKRNNEIERQALVDK